MHRRTLAPLVLAATVLPALALTAPSATASTPAAALNRSASAASAAAAKVPTTASITVLPAVDVVSQPVALTDAGLVVGNAGPSGSVSANDVAVTHPDRPWRWIAGHLQRLPVGSAVEAKVDDANRLGATAGWTATTLDPDGATPQNQRAAQWDLLGRSRPVSVAASEALDVNDQGDLLLNTDALPPGATGSLHVAVLSPKGTETAVDPTFSYPLGSSGLLLTDAGDVVYDVAGAGGTSYFFRWRVGSALAGVQIGFGFTRVGINPCVAAADTGLIAADVPQSDSTPATINLTRADGTSQYLPAAGYSAAYLGCSGVVGHSINQAGDVTGDVWTSGEPGQIQLRPVVWHDGVLRVLGAPAAQGIGEAINDLGQVAGVSVTGSPFSGNLVEKPELWTGTSTLDLPLPAGWTLAAVTQVNNRGQVLGAIQRTTASGQFQTRSVVWTVE